MPASRGWIIQGANHWIFLSFFLTNYAFKSVDAIASNQSMTNIVFMGGSLAIDPIDLKTIMVKALLVWGLTSGPCGPHCSPNDLGKSTVPWRSKAILESGDPEMFGSWFTEIKSGRASAFDNVTSYINRNLQAKVTEVNLQGNWVQESIEVKYAIPSNISYIDFKIEIKSRTHLTLQACSDDPCTFFMQSKFKPGIRNDTGKLDHTASSALTRPIYEVALGQETEIPLMTWDADGDYVVCRAARYVELGGIRPLAIAQISRNCLVTVHPTSAEGSRPGDIGLVSVIVADRRNAMVGITHAYENYLIGPGQQISASQLLFLIRVVPALHPNLFLGPYECVDSSVDSHRFRVTSGVTFSLPFSTNEVGSSSGLVSNVTLSVFPNDGLITLIKSNARKYPFSLLDGSWTLFDCYVSDETNFSQYLILAVASNSRGQESTCLFDMRVGPFISLPPLTLPSNTSTSSVTGTTTRNDTALYMLNCSTSVDHMPCVYAVVPKSLSCEQSVPCVFPVYASVSHMIDISSLSIHNVSHLALEDWILINSSLITNFTHSMNVTRMNIEPVYGHLVGQVDFTFYSDKIGTINLCFIADITVTDRSNDLNISKLVSTPSCIDLKLAKMEHKNPCFVNDTVCGDGECIPDTNKKSGYYCICKIDLTGEHCETSIDLCEGYCVNNSTTICVFDIALAPEPICVCKTGYEGTRCQTKSGS